MGNTELPDLQADSVAVKDVSIDGPRSKENSIQGAMNFGEGKERGLGRKRHVLLKGGIGW